MHKSKDIITKRRLSAAAALNNIDTPSILFFLGILLAVGALEAGGMLKQAAVWLMETLRSEAAVGVCLGLLSAIIDNVPLMAAAQGMYDLESYPADHSFWFLLALTTGTGGSAIIIGSAAGVVAMGIEKINFFWFLKRMSWLALLGFFAGVGTYLLFFY
jgi:Na+/H+ antiporter NhaD/arsenite permease-like protein